MPLCLHFVVSASTEFILDFDPPSNQQPINNPPKPACSIPPAAAGKYSDTAGAVTDATCIDVPSGEFTSQPGSSLEDVGMAQQGYYATTSSDGTEDGFGVSIGATESLRCPAGRFTASSGAYSCEAWYTQNCRCNPSAPPTRIRATNQTLHRYYNPPPVTLAKPQMRISTIVSNGAL